MKEMGLSRPNWTPPGWPRLAFGGCHHRRHATCLALRPGRPPLPGDGSGDRHMPGGRRPLGPANGGVTEDRGYVILRITDDLLYLEFSALPSELPGRNMKPSFGTMS